MISNEELKVIRMEISNEIKDVVRSWHIREYLAKNRGIMMDETTIRGKFVEMGEPLGFSAPVDVKPAVTPISVTPKLSVVSGVPEELQNFIPDANLFNGYISRSVDTRLALHYDIGKHPLTQGKQGTGKTFGHMYYAFKKQLPFLLISCHKNMDLKKFFGDKTIINGSIVFKEGLFIKFISNPSVVLFDEINAPSNEDTYDFHALLQNRELFVKDADNGNGKVFKVHEHCRIGFAQNPKSAKYIGGNVKPSSFLGRCTFITYPEFSKAQIDTFIAERYPQLDKKKAELFREFYFACIRAIDEAEVPIDISIRQLNNVLDLYIHGLPLELAIEDGLTSMLEAASQPKGKEAFFRLAQAVFKELMDKDVNEKIKEVK